MMNVNDVKPHYADGITDTLRSVAFAAGRDIHPEFIRAIYCAALSFGITRDELQNGTRRIGRLYFKETIAANLKSVLSAAGKDVHPEFVRAILAIGLQFNITKQEIL